MNETKLQYLLEKVMDIAGKAGEYIKKERENFSAKDIEYKGKNDLVSYVDKQSEKMITDALMQISPEFGILGEENQNNRKGEWTWVIDPLDGTTNFMHGIPVWCVSIGLVRNNQVVLGVVYDPCHEEMFYAMHRKGAWINGNTIHCSAVERMSGALIGTGFPTKNFHYQDAYLQAMRDLMRNSHGIRRMGSAALDLCYLACGRLDAFFEYNLNPWDVSAGALIAQEAGAKIADFKGQDNWLYGKEIIGANPVLFQDFFPFIHKIFCS